jgi:hypothetical protein
MSVRDDMLERLLHGHCPERPLLLNGEPMTALQRRQIFDLLAIEQARKTHRRVHSIRMAISNYFRQQARGTTVTFKASGGTAAITLASLATSTTDSTGAQQSVKADFESLGSATNTAAQIYAVTAVFKWLTTAPTTNTLIDIYANPSTSSTAGTDNKGNCSGVNEAYTGYNSDISVASKQLAYCGSFVVSAKQDVDQTGFVGFYSPQARYNSIVVWNKSGRLLHSTEGNQVVTFQPIEYTADAS